MAQLFNFLQAGGRPDFSAIGELPQAFAQGEEAARRRQLQETREGLAGMVDPNGAMNYGAMAQHLLSGGDVQGAAQMQRLASEQAKAWQPDWRWNADTKQYHDMNNPSRTMSVPGAEQTSANPYFSGEFSATEADEAGYADAMAPAHKDITQFENYITQGGIGGTAVKAMYSRLGGAGSGYVTSMSDELAQFERAASAMVNAALRRESGATVRDEEFWKKWDELIPSPYDSERLLLNKRRARFGAMKTSARAAGTNYKPHEDFSFAEQSLKGTEDKADPTPMPSKKSELRTGSKYTIKHPKTGASVTGIWNGQNFIVE